MGSPEPFLLPSRPTASPTLTLPHPAFFFWALTSLPLLGGASPPRALPAPPGCPARTSRSPLSSQVKVILGEDREATGILLSIDGEDGIVRMDLDEQLKILNLRFLGKLLEA